MAVTVEVFVSYSRKDQRLWEELKKHLIPMQRKGLISLWDSNTNIHIPGLEWQQEISSHLNTAHLILLLISQHYLASDYLCQIELSRALQLHRDGEATVLPILLQPVYWQDEPFAEIPLLPENQRPVIMWRKKEGAFFHVAVGIRKAIDQLLASPDTKTVNVWISERVNSPREPLFVGETYTLNFNMKQLEAIIDSTASDEPTEETDLTPEGLGTEWLVYSPTTNIVMNTDPATMVSTAADSRAARFSLYIPSRGNSPSQHLYITPISGENARLNVLVYAYGKLYREFDIELAISESHSTGQLQDSDVSAVKDDVIHEEADQLDLQPSSNWQKPPGHLQIAALGHKDVYVTGSEFAINGEFVNWGGSIGTVAGQIKIVRQRAKSFQANWNEYLNNIDPADLIYQLEHFKPQNDWTMLNDWSDSHHQQAWEDVQKSSQELQSLATCGHDLYNTFFPEGSSLRSWLDSLKPGYYLSINWTRQSDEPISSVPWGLMYLKDPDLPIDPLGFFGLRFRIHYTAHASENTKDRSKALGSPHEIYRGNFLYWEDQEQYSTAKEAMWQQSIWENWPKQVFISNSQAKDPGQEPKKTLLGLLRGSGTSQPMPTLYFYCKCNIDDDTGEPTLYFANNNDNPLDMITYEDLTRSKLIDRPFVFMNACTTSASDPYIGNALQSLFFRQGCSAYLGTETEIPVEFASRFAAIFFHFFYRRIKEWPEPIAAGEAVAQARLFLWTQYKNVGGLLYTYVNQYELFMATVKELEKLHQ